MQEVGKLVIFNGFIPLLMGYLLTFFCKFKNKDSILLNYVVGFFAMLAIFEPIALVLIFMKKGLSTLTMLMTIIWVVLAVFSVIFNRKRILSGIVDLKNIRKNISPMMLVAIGLIIMQIYVYAEYTHTDDDDAFFVATATTAIQTNKMYRVSPYTGFNYQKTPTRYIMSPFPMYYASMSEITGINATVYAHLYLPIIMLLLVYGIYYLWSEELFDKERKDSRWIFLTMVSVLNIFGGYSIYSAQSFTILRLWQGKSVLAAAIIPFILYLGYRITKESWDFGKFVILTAFTCSACLVSSMGIFLAPISVGMWALVDLIKEKSIKRIPGYVLSLIPCIICGLIYIGIK